MSDINHSPWGSAHCHVDGAGRDLTKIDDQFIPCCKSDIILCIYLVRNNCSEVGSGSYLRFVFGIIVGIRADRFPLKLIGYTDNARL